MTITAAQVQDVQTTIKDELEAGSFALYGSTPPVYLDVDTKMAVNVWINLTNTQGEIIYAVNNAPLLFDDTCELWIYAPNRTDLNKIYADVVNIFSASSKNIIIERPRDLSVRGKYIKTMRVKLLDI